MEFFDGNDPHPDTLGKVAVFAVIRRAANADLHDPFGIEQIFFDRAAERRAMGVLRTAKIAIE